MLQIFDGKAHSKKLDMRISTLVQDLKARDLLNKELTIIQIGEDSSSTKYTTLKKRYLAGFDIPSSYIKFPADIPYDSLSRAVKDIFISPKTGGGIIQLPLPSESHKRILDEIELSKDIDLLSSKSLTQYYAGNSQKLPPVIRALDYFISFYQLKLTGVKACVIGYGDLVGKPAAYYLLSKGAKATVMDTRYYKDSPTLIERGEFGLGKYAGNIVFKNNFLPEEELDFDLIVTNTGTPKLIKGENVKKDSVIVDFGSAVVDGSTVGDFDLASSYEHLKIISPSPGGMGPLVIRFLTLNFLESF